MSQNEHMELHASESKTFRILLILAIIAGVLFLLNGSGDSETIQTISDTVSETSKTISENFMNSIDSLFQKFT